MGEWHIGDTAMYFQPGDPYHGTPVSIMSELEYGIIYEVGGGPVILSSFYEIKLCDGLHESLESDGIHTKVARPYQLRKPGDVDVEVKEVEESVDV